MTSSSPSPTLGGAPVAAPEALSISLRPMRARAVCVDLAERRLIDTDGVRAMRARVDVESEYQPLLTATTTAKWLGIALAAFGVAHALSSIWIDKPQGRAAVVLPIALIIGVVAGASRGRTIVIAVVAGFVAAAVAAFAGFAGGSVAVAIAIAVGVLGAVLAATPGAPEVELDAMLGALDPARTHPDVRSGALSFSGSSLARVLAFVGSSIGCVVIVAALGASRVLRNVDEALLPIGVVLLVGLAVLSRLWSRRPARLAAFVPIAVVGAGVLIGAADDALSRDEESFGYAAALVFAGVLVRVRMARVLLFTAAAAPLLEHLPRMFDGAALEQIDDALFAVLAVSTAALWAFEPRMLSTRLGALWRPAAFSSTLALLMLASTEIRWVSMFRASLAAAGTIGVALAALLFASLIGVQGKRLGITALAIVGATVLLWSAPAVAASLLLLTIGIVRAERWLWSLGVIGFSTFGAVHIAGSMWDVDVWVRAAGCVVLGVGAALLARRVAPTEAA